MSLDECVQPCNQHHNEDAELQCFSDIMVQTINYILHCLPGLSTMVQRQK